MAYNPWQLAAGGVPSATSLQQWEMQVAAATQEPLTAIQQQAQQWSVAMQHQQQQWQQWHLLQQQQQQHWVDQVTSNTLPLTAQSTSEPPPAAIPSTLFQPPPPPPPTTPPANELQQQLLTAPPPPPPEEDEGVEDPPQNYQFHQPPPQIMRGRGGGGSRGFERGRGRGRGGGYGERSQQLNMQRDIESEKIRALSAKLEEWTNKLTTWRKEMENSLDSEAFDKQLSQYEEVRDRLKMRLDDMKNRYNALTEESAKEESTITSESDNTSRVPLDVKFGFGVDVTGMSGGYEGPEDVRRAEMERKQFGRGKGYESYENVGRGYESYGNAGRGREPEWKWGISKDMEIDREGDFQYSGEGFQRKASRPPPGRGRGRGDDRRGDDFNYQQGEFSDDRNNFYNQDNFQGYDDSRGARGGRGNFRGRPPPGFEGRPPHNDFRGRPTEDEFRGRPTEDDMRGRPGTEYRSRSNDRGRYNDDVYDYESRPIADIGMRREDLDGSDLAEKGLVTGDISALLQSDDKEYGTEEQLFEMAETTGSSLGIAELFLSSASSSAGNQGIPGICEDNFPVEEKTKQDEADKKIASSDPIIVERTKSPGTPMITSGPVESSEWHIGDKNKNLQEDKLNNPTTNMPLWESNSKGTPVQSDIIKPWETESQSGPGRINQWNQGPSQPAPGRINPWDQSPRQPAPGKVNPWDQGQRGPGPNNQRPRGPAPGNQGPRGPVPGNQGPRGPVPGNQGPRGPVPANMGPRGPVPANMGPRAPIPGNQELAPRVPVPGSVGPRGAAPGNVGPRGAAPGNVGPRGAAPGNVGPRSAAPGNQGPRVPTPGPRGPSPVNQGTKEPIQNPTGSNVSNQYPPAPFRPPFPGMQPQGGPAPGRFPTPIPRGTAGMNQWNQRGGPRPRGSFPRPGFSSGMGGYPNEQNNLVSSGDQIHTPQSFPNDNFRESWGNESLGRGESIPRGRGFRGGRANDKPGGYSQEYQTPHVDEQDMEFNSKVGDTGGLPVEFQDEVEIHEGGSEVGMGSRNFEGRGGPHNTGMGRFDSAGDPQMEPEFDEMQGNNEFGYPPEHPGMIRPRGGRFPGRPNFERGRIGRGVRMRGDFGTGGSPRIPGPQMFNRMPAPGNFNRGQPQFPRGRGRFDEGPAIRQRYDRPEELTDRFEEDRDLITFDESDVVGGDGIEFAEEIDYSKLRHDDIPERSHNERPIGREEPAFGESFDYEGVDAFASRRPPMSMEDELEFEEAVDYNHSVPGRDPVDDIQIEVIDYGHGDQDDGRREPWRRGEGYRDGERRRHDSREDRYRSRYRDGDRDRDRDRGRSRSHGHDSVERDRSLIRDSRRYEDDRGRDIPRDRDRDFSRDRDRDYARDRGDHRERDRDYERERERDLRRDRTREYRKERDSHDTSRDRNRDRDGRRSDELKRDLLLRKDSPDIVKKDEDGQNKLKIKPKSEPEFPYETVKVEDIFYPPQRNNRPKRIAIILRGPPGSGKSYVAQQIKEKEKEYGSEQQAIRILSLDDYFVTENEKTKEHIYEYDESLEKRYRVMLAKTFKKTVDDLYFPVIVLDSVNSQVHHFEELTDHARLGGFQVYVIEMTLDVKDCIKQNVHKRKVEDIEFIIRNWERTPSYFTRLDITGLKSPPEKKVPEESVELKPVEDLVESISDKSSIVVEDLDNISDLENDLEDVSAQQTQLEEDSQDNDVALTGSKWEVMETVEERDRLDGLKKRSKGHPESLEDWLQISDDYEIRESKSGGKRVRWADLEAKKQQERARAVGFVIGQTDWGSMTDPSYVSDALTQTKYI